MASDEEIIELAQQLKQFMQLLDSKLATFDSRLSQLENMFTVKDGDFDYIQ